MRENARNFKKFKYLKNLKALMSNNSRLEEEFSRIYFTAEQAAVLLPKIKKILKRVISLNKALDILSSIEIEVYDDDYENLKKVTRINLQFHKLSYQFFSGIEKMEDMGCVVKDYEAGIIDFYSRFEGRDIFLCWRIGEPSIGYWHEIGEGYAGRKPIFELKRS